MRHPDRGRLRQQARFLRRQFLQDGSLPFSNVLSERLVAQTLTAINVRWLDRIYSPLVTLWAFLGQVLSADHSCRAAVALSLRIACRRGSVPVLRRLAPTARPESDCLKHSFRMWRVSAVLPWKPASIRSGCGRDVVCIPTMVRQSRCLIRLRISAIIRKTRRSSPA